MSDGSDPTQKHLEPPPSGDDKKAEKYIHQLTTLISQDKIAVYHTDLSKFDPSSLQDHYRIGLKDYSAEISHSKQPNSGRDSFVLLFTNLKQVEEGCTEKIILAYMHLSDTQYQTFKEAANQQIDRRFREEQELKFKSAMTDIDKVFDELTVGTEVAPEFSEQIAPMQTEEVTPEPEQQSQTGVIDESTPKDLLNPAPETENNQSEHTFTSSISGNPIQ